MLNLGSVKYCLNQESRPDRWKQASDEFARVGLMDVQRFLSIPADQPNKSFCLSQYAMLRAFLETEGKILTIYEDDVLFRDIHSINKIKDELPNNWDTLYLGANITDGVFGIKERPPVRYSTHLFRIRAAWTTHAIIYTRKIADIIVRHYPVHTFEMYDQWLNANILPNYNCFLINPMICYQRPGRSDLWGHHADYTGAFEWGDKFMKDAG